MRRIFMFLQAVLLSIWMINTSYSSQEMAYRYYQVPMLIGDSSILSPFYLYVNSKNLNCSIEKVDPSLPGVKTLIQVLACIRSEDVKGVMGLMASEGNTKVDPNRQAAGVVKSLLPRVQGTVHVVNVFRIGKDVYYFLGNNKKNKTIIPLKETENGGYAFTINPNLISQLLAQFYYWDADSRYVNGSDRMNLNGRLRITNYDGNESNELFLSFQYEPVMHPFMKGKIPNSNNALVNEILSSADRTFMNMVDGGHRAEEALRMDKQSRVTMNDQGEERVKGYFNSYRRRLCNLVIYNENTFFVFSRSPRIHMLNAGDFKYDIFRKDEKGTALVNFFSAQPTDMVLRTPDAMKQFLSLETGENVQR